MKILVTGCSGLIGSAAVEHYDGQGHEIVGISWIKIKLLRRFEIDERPFVQLNELLGCRVVE